MREKRREARIAFIQTPEGREALERALGSAHKIHVASTAALPGLGLVPAKQAAALAAPFLNYSPSTILQSLKTQLRTPNGLPRRGAYVEDLLAVEVNGTRLDADARRKLGGQLAKVQSASRGTDFGKPRIDTERPGTSARIVELREAGRSYREIAKELGVSKSHVERVAKAPQPAAVPIP